MSKTKEEVNAEIEKLLADPSTHWWLKDSLKAALKLDLLDAARDAEVLAHLLNARWEVMQNDR